MPRITITIDYPEGLPITIGGPPAEVENDDQLLPSEVLTRVRQHGRATAAFQETLLQRVAEELGCRVEPTTGKRLERINVYPPTSHHRRTRIAGLNARSGRLAFPTLPASIADEYDGVEVIYNNRSDGTVTADGVKIYLRTTDDVEAAVELARRTLDQS